ncbi:hypothetical protein WJX77_003765 [Trebouxia sp. C0004]
MVEEAALLRLIEEAVKSMLTRCFQKYHAVSDRAPTGILKGDMANPESPSSVLRHAVKLADVLKKDLKPNMELWLTNCLQVAAVCCFEAVNATSESEACQVLGRLSDVDAVIYNVDRAEDIPGFQAAYAQLEGLSQAIVSELQSDLELHDTGIFPQPIQLHQITSAEYCKLFLGKLKRVLERNSPPEPSSAAINLMLGVGKFEHWFEGSQAKLLQTCQALEGSGGSNPLSYVAGEETGHGVIAPLLIEMLQNIQTELQRFEKPVFQWQQPPQVIGSPISPQPRRAPSPSSSRSILPFEAVLLNSLRQLLTFVPQTNDLLTAWARTTADSPGRERMPTPNQSPTKIPIEQEGEGPQRGALFNQLVKELRSEYAAAVTACAQRIHSALADHRCSIRAALEKYGIANDSAVLMEQMHPTLEAAEDVLASLLKVVDNLVYVSVGRGLWDCTSQDVYEYLEGLQEGLGLNRGAWLGRQNSKAVMDVVDKFSQQPSQPPNTTAINMAYTVF